MKIQSLLHTAIQTLKQANQPSDSPALDAQILLAHVLKKDRTYLFTWPEKCVSPPNIKTFHQFIHQREIGHPIAQIIGEKEFWGLTFKVTPNTLIPRPDTEILVETALEKINSLGKIPKILDLGTGTGAIICALKYEQPQIQATATDLQPKALEVAQSNAKRHHLDIQFLQGSWLTPVQGQTFDLIVSNPPYIDKTDPHLTQGDVRFDPITALTASDSGLNDLKTIIKTAKIALNAQAWLILEHGFEQAQSVRNLFKTEGYVKIETRNDLNHNPRVTFAQWQEPNE